jgi:hypothetical protein
MVPLLVGAAYVANQIADTIPPLAAKCGAPDYTGYAEGFGDALDFAEQPPRVVTVSTDPAATLHDLADYYRRLAEVTPLGGERQCCSPWLSTSKAQPTLQTRGGMARQRSHRRLPLPYCADTSELLAVADAAGITSERQGTV